jgi:hypothetical protein
MRRIELSQKALKKLGSNTLSTHISDNEDDSLFTDKCYTIEKNSCMIHGFCKQCKSSGILEMCELYNLFTKSCNTKARKASHFCPIITNLFKK